MTKDKQNRREADDLTEMVVGEIHLHHVADVLRADELAVYAERMNKQTDLTELRGIVTELSSQMLEHFRHEDSLISVMRTQSVLSPDESALVRMMELEHGTIVALLRRLSEAVNAPGNRRDRLAALLKDVSLNVRAHDCKEEQVLYPVARERISSSVARTLAEKLKQ